jgi:hypothetical protein
MASSRRCSIRLDARRGSELPKRALPRAITNRRALGAAADSTDRRSGGRDANHRSSLPWDASSASINRPTRSSYPGNAEGQPPAGRTKAIPIAGDFKTADRTPSSLWLRTRAGSADREHLSAGPIVAIPPALAPTLEFVRRAVARISGAFDAQALILEQPREDGLAPRWQSEAVCT